MWNPSNLKTDWLPSILAANPLYLADALDKIQRANLNKVHIDVMDGHFVPNICMGPDIVAAIRDHTKMFRDVHLMLSNPQNLIETFICKGAQRITIHVELDSKIIQQCIEISTKNSIEMGLAINPGTNVNQLCPYLDQGIQHVIVMSVNPGFSGQKFIPSVLKKVQFLKERYPQLSICMDGGINAETAASCIQSGANACVVGAYFFHA